MYVFVQYGKRWEFSEVELGQTYYQFQNRETDRQLGAVNR